MTKLAALYRLLLRRQISAGRLLLFAGFGALSIAVGLAIGGSSTSRDATSNIVEFVFGFGIGLMVPVISLVLSSSTLGELVDDETLVYLWHRPSPRWLLATAAWLGSLTVIVPATVLPLALTALLGTGEIDTTVAVAWAATLAGVGYSGLFLLLGLVLRRALIWGLVYLFVWELFISRVGNGAARLSINTYPSSVLARLTDVSLPLAERSTFTGVAVPVAVAIGAVALTSWRLDHSNVA